ncbi:MAG: bifunctional diaminohydroxyphosphoribosylaminopyrimidine deaminase/5-amino-6-(5-phosphoribosylamino)uracil reductase RibD [Deltaproteobacteria bacterium]|nr:bifunctional diaminohydroxyphosphoribosylaminopyrimidine deaminase/5-amino-6-(5-phosphoribosylamino)uracil reductase RibD [Deltaproteobacteria bacterium]
MDDKRYMSRAIGLARKAMGKTCPNPVVGAVIVKNGKIIGEGYHKKAGLPHAEIEAVKSVKDKTKLLGSTMYVTLEPCSHYGRTPPCTLAILNSGIRRVVAATSDPNPESSHGMEVLRQKGIETEIGVLEKEARKLNEVFITNVRKKRPFYALKAAMTLNGLIAVRGGNSQWITGEKARLHVHFLRSIYNAILVGINTIHMDDPLLTCRFKKKIRQPFRIVLDTFLKISPSSKIFSVYPRKIIIICGEETDSDKQKKIRATGAKIIKCKVKDGRVDLHDLSQKLLSLDICSVMVEGGSLVHGSFIKEKLIDRCFLFYGPMLCGSHGGFNAIGCDAPDNLSQALKLTDIRCRMFDEDILVEGKPCSAV